MPNYRIYRFEDGHIIHAVSLDCDDDAEAVAEFAEGSEGAVLELWDGARMVARIEPVAPDPEH